MTLDRELSPGLQLTRRSCPIGVLCVIFEAVRRGCGYQYSGPAFVSTTKCRRLAPQRPEAVIQISTLALKSGNSVILKGGKEAARTNEALVRAIQASLASSQVPPSAVQLVSGREEVADLLHLDEEIDLVIPRGSKELVRSIKARTRIPVLGHADGICSVFVDAAADLDMAGASRRGGALGSQHTTHPLCCCLLPIPHPTPQCPSSLTARQTTPPPATLPRCSSSTAPSPTALPARSSLRS